MKTRNDMFTDFFEVWLKTFEKKMAHDFPAFEKKIMIDSVVTNIRAYGNNYLQNIDEESSPVALIKVILKDTLIHMKEMEPTVFTDAILETIHTSGDSSAKFEAKLFDYDQYAGGENETDLGSEVDARKELFPPVEGIIDPRSKK
jgi:hypothetical protein